MELGVGVAGGVGDEELPRGLARGRAVELGSMAMVGCGVWSVPPVRARAPLCPPSS